jgi:hypothetical protein
MLATHVVQRSGLMNKQPQGSTVGRTVRMVTSPQPESASSASSEVPQAFQRETKACVRECVRAVVDSPEITEALVSLGTEAELQVQLEAEAPRLARASAAYAAWHSAWSTADDPTELADTEKSSSWGIGLALFLFLLVLLGLAVGLGALLIGYGTELINGKLRSWPHWGWLVMAASGASVLVIIVPLVVLGDRMDNRKNRARLEAKQSAASLTESSARLRFTTDLTEQLNALARTILNAASLAAASDSRLRVRRWPGLSEAYDDVYWVETSAAAELRAHVDQIGSGSIGLAGPRGSGKSTLMRLYCTATADPSDTASNLVFMVPAPVAYIASDFLVLMFSELCRAYLTMRKGPRAVAEVYAPPVLPRTGWLRGRRHAQRRVVRERWPLTLRARDHLANLQYMITYSATLSISAPIPIMQPNISGGSSFEKRAMSYPELVADFRAFLTDVAQEMHAGGGRVFIGIDEIDKIDSGPDAQRFVNELKVLFGIPHCFYLISVSEDALTGFELRGLPVRDAFDSAFETKILSVGSLRIGHARELLAKRVVGLSEPYIWLCHCLSGGLPRDLIRACVQVIRIGQRYSPDQRLLERLTRAVVAEELRDKANATMRSWAGRAPAAPDRELVYRIQGIDSAEAAAEGVRAVVAWVAERIGATGDTTMAVSTAVLGGYAYYCLTLLEVFDGVTDAASLEAHEMALENLANARRTFGDDAQLAWQLISDFRSDWGLETIRMQLPEAVS